MDVGARFPELRLGQILAALSASAEPRMTLQISGSTAYKNVRSRGDPTLRRRGREGPQWVGLSRWLGSSAVDGFDEPRMAAVWGGYLPLAPAVSSVRYPIRLC
jgi:hypothetical protein